MGMVGTEGSYWVAPVVLVAPVERTASATMPPAVARVGGVLVAVAGLLLRVWVIGRTPLNADVAVVGLMARQILHGHFSAFYWGQSYGGAEPYVVAAVFGLLGSSSFTLALTPLLLDVLSCVLVWRIGRRLFSPRVGTLAALLFWFWPPVYVTESTLEYGFRWLALCCGLGVLLVALRIGGLGGVAGGGVGGVGASGIGGLGGASGLDEVGAVGGIGEAAGSGSWRRLADWALLGALAGLGWWCSPEIVYFLVPAIAVVVALHVRARRWPRPGAVLVALAAAGVGALAWVWANIRSGLGSLHAGAQATPSYHEHLKVFFVRVLPMVLGLRRPISGDWILVPPFGEAAYGLVLAFVVGWCAVLVWRRQGFGLVVFLGVFPFLYAASPFTWFWNDGRYALYLSPMVALLLASAACSPRRVARRRSASHDAPSPSVAGGVVLMLAAVALSLAAEAQMSPFTPVRVASAPRSSWFSWRANPNEFLVRLGGELEANHVRDLYSGYWTAYPLDFESKGRLVATPLGAVYARNRAMLADVEGSADPAWLFARSRDLRQLSPLAGTTLLDPGCAVKGDRCLTAGELQDWLQSHRLDYRLLDLGDYQAVVPGRSIPPQQVLSAFHIAR